MTAAYILMQFSAGDPWNVMKSIHRVAGVKQAHLLAGPTDAIAYVEATDHESLAKIVAKLRGIKGVAATDTRMTMPGG